MSQELVLAASIRAVGSAVTAVVTTYRGTREIRKADLEALQESLKEAKLARRSRAQGDLLGVVFEELDRYQRRLDSSSLTGPARQCAVDNLYVLHDALMRNFKEF